MKNGKQYFLVKLDNDHSKYTDADWDALFKYMKNHDGIDMCWSNIRCPERGRDRSQDFLSRPRPTISIGCDSFKSVLTMGSLMEVIRKG